MGPRECIKKYWLYIRNLPEEHGVYWKIWSLYIKSLDIILSAREYQEIHPYSAMYIDSIGLIFIIDDVFIDIDVEIYFVFFLIFSLMIDIEIYAV